jgi:hypothetical protein
MSGLQDIDANDIIADGITIFSNLNISGTTNLNHLLIFRMFIYQILSIT